MIQGCFHTDVTSFSVSVMPCCECCNCCMQQWLFSITFPSLKCSAWEQVQGIYSLQHLCTLLAEQVGARKGHVKHLLLLSFPNSRLLCPFRSISTEQHLDAGLKDFSSEQNLLAKSQTLGFTGQTMSSSSQYNTLQYLWSMVVLKGQEI